MARYQIVDKHPRLDIELTEVAGREAALLEAFGECQEGRCSCPTDEYQKVASMEVTSKPDQIEIRLQPKPGSTLDVSQIAACLDHTIAKGAGG